MLCRILWIHETQLIYSRKTVTMANENIQFCLVYNVTFVLLGLRLHMEYVWVGVIGAVGKISAF